MEKNDNTSLENRPSLRKTNENLKNKICWIDGSEALDLLQIHSPSANDKNDEGWIKFRSAKSKKTFLCTKTLMINHTTKCLTQWKNFNGNRATVESLVTNALKKRSEQQVKSLNEDERFKESKRGKNDEVVAKVAVTSTKSEQIVDDPDRLTSIVDNAWNTVFEQIESIFDGVASEGLIPGMDLDTLTRCFFNPFDHSGDLMKSNDLDQVPHFVQIKIDTIGPCTFFNTNQFQDSINAEIWERSIDPIVWNGVPAVGKSEALEDLDNQNSTLSSLEKLVERINQQTSDEEGTDSEEQSEESDEKTEVEPLDKNDSEKLDEDDLVVEIEEI